MGHWEKQNIESIEQDDATNLFVSASCWFAYLSAANKLADSDKVKENERKMHPSFFIYSLFRAVFGNSWMQRKNTRHERGGEKQKVFSTLAALFKKKHKILLSFFLFPPSSLYRKK